MILKPGLDKIKGEDAGDTDDSGDAAIDDLRQEGELGNSRDLGRMGRSRSRHFFNVRKEKRNVDSSDCFKWLMRSRFNCWPRRLVRENNKTGFSKKKKKHAHSRQRLRINALNQMLTGQMSMSPIICLDLGGKKQIA